MVSFLHTCIIIMPFLIAPFAITPIQPASLVKPTPPIPSPRVPTVAPGSTKTRSPPPLAKTVTLAKEAVQVQQCANPAPRDKPARHATLVWQERTALPTTRTVTRRARCRVCRAVSAGTRTKRGRRRVCHVFLVNISIKRGKL